MDNENQWGMYGTRMARKSAIADNSSEFHWNYNGTFNQLSMIIWINWTISLKSVAVLESIAQSQAPFQWQKQASVGFWSIQDHGNVILHSVTGNI